MSIPARAVAAMIAFTLGLCLTVPRASGQAASSLVANSAATATAPAGGATVAGADGWYQFMGPARNGVWEGPPLATTWPADGPRVIWRVPCRVGYSGLIVLDGVVVLMEREPRRRPGRPAIAPATGTAATQPDGLPDEVIRGLDAATGKELWRVSYPCVSKGGGYGVWGPAATPAAAAGKVVCLGVGGRLQCLELKTGRVLWSKDLAAEFQMSRRGGHDEYQTSSSPLIVGDLVIQEVCSTVGLVAWRLTDGEEVWRTRQFANYGSSTGFQWIGGLPVVLAVPVARGPYKGDVLGFDARDGEVAWWQSAGKNYYNTVCPVANEGLVVVDGGGGDGPTLAFRPPEDGQGRARLLWKHAEHIPRFSNPVIYRGLVFGQGYFGHGQPPGRKQYCLDAADGKLLWEQPAKESHQWMLASDGKIIQLHEGGELSLYDADARTGCKELARARVIGHTWAYPCLWQGRLYLRNDTEAVCVDLRPSGEVSSAPAGG